MADKGNIVIKKVKKVSGGGHHGGAWKVAYADFVTAMMAFFLLMWLLNATEAENLAGLADYFAPTVGVKDEMGIGFRGGKSALSDGIGADRNTNKGIVFGGVPAGPITKVTQKIEERTEQPDMEQIQIIVDKSKSESQDRGKGSASVAASESSDEEIDETAKAMDGYVQDLVKKKRVEDGSIEMKRVPEGLSIQIKDVDGESMFEENEAIIKDNIKDALKELSKILRNIPNNIAIIGHTSSNPIQGKGIGYTKWELSTDRANETRIFLQKNGVQKEQFSRIEGRADNIPYDRRRPEAPINDRVNIILMKQKDTPNHKQSSPDSLFLNLNSSQTKGFTKKSTEKEKEIDLRKNEEMEKIIDEAIGIPNSQ
jgi:chemotaxis protein MotB